jgi:hypothetical protein
LGEHGVENQAPAVVTNSFKKKKKERKKITGILLS